MFKEDQFYIGTHHESSYSPKGKRRIVSYSENMIFLKKITFPLYDCLLPHPAKNIQNETRPSGLRCMGKRSNPTCLHHGPPPRPGWTSGP